MRVLVIDDNPDDRMLVLRELRRTFGSLQAEEVIDAASFARMLASGPVDVVITDYKLGWSTGLVVLHEIKARYPECPVIMFTSSGNEEIAVEAMKSGLYDYIYKSHRYYRRLGAAVHSALNLREARQRASHLEVRLQFLTDRLNVGVYRATPAGQLLECNAALLRLLGCASLEEARGMDLNGLFLHFSDRQALLEELQVRGRLEEREVQLHRVDGRDLWVVLNEHLVEHQGEAVIDGLMEDITARKHDEERRRQAHDALERRVEERTIALQREMLQRQRLERETQRAQHFALLGRLAAGVAHEIRNPLTAVLLYVNLLEEELRSPSSSSAVEVPQMLTEMKTNLVRLDDLMQDYLSLVRLTDLRRDAQDLGTTVQTWAVEWQRLARACGIVLQLEGLATLGVVAFHGPSLQRALLNVVQNALEAMPHGGTLTLTGQAMMTHVQIHVRDTGSGLLPEQIAHIFDPLYTTKPGGTGLGLYIVQEILVAHGGRVTVQSTAGQGATFTLILPRAATEGST